MISADPPDASRQFRRDLKLTLTLVSDQELETANHYDIAVSYRSPRVQVYPHGFIQAATMYAYHHEQQILASNRRPSVFNGYGAYLRPSPKKVLRRLRRAIARQR